MYKLMTKMRRPFMMGAGLIFPQPLLMAVGGNPTVGSVIVGVGLALMLWGAYLTTRDMK